MKPVRHVRRIREMTFPRVAIGALTLSVGWALPFAAQSGATSKHTHVAPRSTTPKPPTKKQIQYELNKLASEAGKEAKATFKITYVWKNSASSGSVTLEQKPPDEAFSTGTGKFIYNGKKTYYCTVSSSYSECITYASLSTNPLAGTMHVYDSSLYIDAMKGWETVVASGIAGYKVSFSSANFAGQPSECVNWSYKGISDKYCVTNNDLLAYTGGSTAAGQTFSFTLKSFTSSVSSSDFQPPKGAHVINA
jgi:hypothetical protein